MLMMYLSVLETPEEQSKFEELYNQYRKLMYLCAKEILKDDALAEDAVQDAFLKIIYNFHKIGEVNCNRTKRFVVIVVENISIDIYRKERKMQRVPLETLEEIHQFQTPHQSENLTEIERAIEELPLIYKHVFQLKFGWGYSNEEIMEILNITRNNLKQRLFRGRQLLLERLKEMEVYVGVEDRDH